MENSLLQKIEKAYLERDLKTLNSLAEPTYREINSGNDFSSALMLSCNNLKHLTKIVSSEADCIILNLEDGVPKADKPFALVICAIFLSKLAKCDKKLVVRVNAIEENGYDEITYLNQFMPDAIRVPKVKNAREVSNVLALLKDNVELHLTIETAEAWHNLQSLKVDKRVTCFYLGVLDLFADMHIPQKLINKDNPTMQYILSHFLISCKAMGVKPVSFMYQDYKNLEEFGMWLSLEKSIGYDAKGCISPAQVALVNKAFVHDEHEIQKAKEIIKLFEESQKRGITGFVNDKYGFIDEPIYKGALALLNDNK